MTYTFKIVQKKIAYFAKPPKIVLKTLNKLKLQPNVANLKKLKGESQYFRIRSGDYRIGIKIEEDLVTFF